MKRDTVSIYMLIVSMLCLLSGSAYAQSILPATLSAAPAALSLSTGALSDAYNVARSAKATASSQLEGFEADKVNDGVVRIDGIGEWRSAAQQMFWGETDYPWIRLDWEQPVTVNRILIYDRPGKEAHTAGAEILFSDGTRLDAGRIPEDGSPLAVDFNPVTTDFIQVNVVDGDNSRLGLSEIEVFRAPESYVDYVEHVDPYIETTRSRYFFFITGNQPMGMIGAAPMTRNKNQGGGGYNYNDRFILGFPQIHGWMLSGLELMPASGKTDPTGGEEEWKSLFSHDGEIVKPAYHRVYLDDHDVWVEQTATQRTSIYRMTYTTDEAPNILLNLGGYVGTSTMVNANVEATAPNLLEGYFDTTGRLWGGPENVRIYFVAEFDKVPERLDVWDSGKCRLGETSLHSTSKAVARNEGMSYYDAPTSGIRAVFPPMKGEPILMKMAISYVGVENARENMASENPGWDFDAVCAASRKEWNDWLGRIDVKGGSDAQRVKFYTDMWHTLLGRHKINDVNGQYPDRTHLLAVDNRAPGDDFKVRTVPKSKDGSLLHNMYNSDALWLTQWNQNTLWGIAYPALLDDFSASMVAYAENGGLIPRGPCGGGYSFIMSGCPATSMITSAYQRGLTRKWNPKRGYEAMKRNHERGGMLGARSDSEFDFYEAEGYAPGKAGMTVQWTFEDWALAQMAGKMGRKRDAERLLKRSEGWRKLMHPELGLMFPKNADGSWVHTDPQSGNGFEEANSWQTTFGLSHDLRGLAEAMGGEERLCTLLDSAMRQGVKDNFIGSYGRGYVNYGNQPGLSTAHVFNHAGHPDLTQYWVRQVKEKAYGAITPYNGYGGHDEDQGQMSGVSALMAIGLFSVDGGSAINPSYDITSPVFDEVTITLDPDYYPGGEFRIVTHDNSPENCYIRSMSLNGRPHAGFSIPHAALAAGGVLDLHLSSRP